MAVRRDLPVLEVLRIPERRFATLLVFAAALIVGCAGPEPFFTRLDGGPSSPADAGAAGANGDRGGMGGSSPGTGGPAGANGAGGGGAGGAGGIGGGPESSGGATSATGGSGPGGGGAAGSGAGGGGGGGRGGSPAGSGGSAGAPASGGATASGGRGGTGSGGAGIGGLAGTMGGGGGAVGPPGPCTGLCANPGQVPPKLLKTLGTGATCDEVVGTDIIGVVCGNFQAPRTFSANATPIDCVTGGPFTLPRPRNGGFCMQASAGGGPFAYFNTF